MIKARIKEHSEKILLVHGLIPNTTSGLSQDYLGS